MQFDKYYTAVILINIYCCPLNSSHKDTILFQNICVLRDSALNVLLRLLGQLDQSLLLGIVKLGLGFPLLLQCASDGLVLPANLMGQASKESKLQRTEISA